RVVVRVARSAGSGTRTGAGAGALTRVPAVSAVGGAGGPGSRVRSEVGGPVPGGARLGEVAAEPVRGLGHVVVPDRSRQPAAEPAGHRDVVALRIADPDSGRQLRGVTEEPSVHHVLRVPYLH